MKHLIFKEILVHLYELRFTVCLVLVPVLFGASGIVFVGRYEADLERYRQVVNANDRGLRDAAEELSGIVHYDQHITLRPHLLSLCAAGSERSLPSEFTTDVFTFDLPQVSEETNFLLPHFADIDWVFLVSAVVSLLTFLLGYDTISRERETGSLRLVLSNAVSRSSLLLAKYLGAMVSLSIPLVLGVLVCLVVILSSKAVALDAGTLVRMGVIVLLSLLTLSVCLLLSLLVSVWSQSSATSILVLLLFWGIWLFVIPGIAGVIARKSESLPLPSEIDRQIAEARNQIWNAETRKDGRIGYWGPDFSRMNLPGRARMERRRTDAANRIREAYLHDMLGQARHGQLIAKLSPFTLYVTASEAVAGTGIFRAETAWKDLKRYRRELLAFLQEQDRTDPNSYHCIMPRGNRVWEGKYAMSVQPVDPNWIPRFQERRRSLTESFVAVPVDLGLLILLNVVLFMGSYVSFARADIT